MVYLSSISYVLGEPMPIAELADPTVAAELDNLRQEGLRTVRVSGMSAVEMGALAGSQALNALPLTTPELLLYATESTCEPAEDIWQLAKQIGLAGVPSMTIGGNGCANLAPAIRAAAGVILAEGLSAVLVITADVEDSASRYQPFGTTVTSDGAAACFITAEPVNGSFELLGTETRIRADLERDVRPIVRAHTIAKEVKGALAELRARRIDVNAFDAVFTGNYGLSTRKFLVSALGLPDGFDQPDELAGDMGHCPSADLLVSLSHWQRGRQRADRASLLLLATSSRTWSLIAVRYVVSARRAGHLGR